MQDLTREQLLAVAKLKKAKDTLEKEYRLKFWCPYGCLDEHREKNLTWQTDFCNAGGAYRERMLMAANRVGKTETAAFEVACHMTGLYPDWWEGKRFEEAVLVWTGSPTNLTSRDIVQMALLGGIGETLGSGSIPKHLLIGKPKMKQAGVADVVDTFEVRHISGGASKCVLKTYDQGWRTWQGGAPHIVWDDEEPSKGAFPTDEDYKVYSEAQTRVITKKGIILVTFTPLYGMTPLVEHFHKDIGSTVLFSASWEDAPHLSESDKAELRESYPDHEVDARTKGVPMLGSGAVFRIREETIKCAPFEIPSYYARICGVDFGIDHPFAAVWIAWDRDADIIYVTDCYKEEGQLPPVHSSAIKRRGEWIPVSWPHDGVNKDKGSGTQLHMLYRSEGVNLLAKSARYKKARGEKKEKGGSQPQEPIILEIEERMATGRFKVFSHLEDWLKEYRSYHRKDGRLVDRNDDVLKATFYGVMMKRYAIPLSIPSRRRPQASIISAHV